MQNFPRSGGILQFWGNEQAMIIPPVLGESLIIRKIKSKFQEFNHCQGNLAEPKCFE